MTEAMKHEKIVEGLSSWMRVPTWSTIHPLDQERFHRALKDVFDACGLSISGDEFEAAMRDLATKFEYHYEPEYLNKVVNRYAQRAENIGSYLFDNRDR